MTEPITTLLRKFPRAEVAAAVGASERTVRRWANGSHDPQSAHLAGIVSFLNRPENLRKLGRRKPLSFEEVFGSKAA